MKVVNISLLGNKDAGKSTLIGKIAMLTKSISDARIKEAKNESKKLGKEIEPAFILDTFKEERENGLTIDTTSVKVQYKNVGFQFIDVPGHEYLIKNMLTGASKGEIGIVVVSSKRGEGITSQTKRHVILANMLGINKFIIFINKMDLNYSKNEYNKIVKKLNKFFSNINNEIKSMYFIPGSALTGDGILKHSNKFNWYNGKPLIKYLYSLVKQDRKTNENVSNIISLQGIFEDKIFGKIISGNIRKNKIYYLMPDDKKVLIKTYKKNGSSVSLKINKLDKANINGKILVENKNDVIVSDKINAKMFFIKKPEKYFYIYFLGRKYEASLNYKENKKNFVFINGIIKLKEKLAYQSFNKIKEIGRFVIYDKNLKFNGFGII